MHLGVCMCFCGSRTRGGADKAGHPFPVSRNHSLCFKRDKPAFPRNILRFFALFAGSRPFLHSCPHGLLGGTALRHLALTLLPENSREDSDDLRNGQPGCRPQAPSSHLCAFHKEGGSPPGLCPKGLHSSCLPKCLSLTLPPSGAFWRLPSESQGLASLREGYTSIVHKPSRPPQKAPLLGVK